MSAHNSSIGAIDRGILLFQGKTIEELNAQRGQDYWHMQQARVAEVNELIAEARGK